MQNHEAIGLTLRPAAFENPRPAELMRLIKSSV